MSDYFSKKLRALNQKTEQSYWEKKMTELEKEEEKKKRRQYERELLTRTIGRQSGVVGSDDIAPIRTNKEEEATDSKIESFLKVASNEDFESRSGYISTKSDNFWDKLSSKYGMGYNDLQYEYINNQNGIRDEISHKALTWGSDNGKTTTSYEEKALDYMTDDEVAVYNYYYQTGGKEKAQEFLDAIAETLSARKAGKDFTNLQGETTREILYGAVSGSEQFKQGVKSLGNMVVGKDDYIPQTSTQILTGMIREDLADDGFKVLGNSVGQAGFDALSTGANMLPSVAVGMVNPVAGAVLMGSSAAGNAYQQDLNETGDKDKARLYATTIGTLEGALQYALGGIGKLGGLSSTISRAVSGIKNGALRFSLEYGGKIASEALEEGLQEILDPLVKNAIHGTDESIDWENVAYSGLLGGLMGGVFGASEVTSSHLNTDEQTVINKVYEDRVAKAEEGGKKLTGKEKSKIYDVVQEQMKKGYIDADTVESILGGESYTKYKTAMDNFFGSDTYKSYRSAEDAKKSLPKLQEEYDTLHAMKRGDMTGEQQDREASLLEQINAIKNAPDTSALKAQLDTEAAVINDMKAKLRGEVSSRVKGGYLAESYKELIRKDQKFEADMSKYTDENAKKTVQNILDSGIRDNSNQFHETVDFLARISADKGVTFKLTDNKQLAGTVHDRDGLRVNGFKIGNEITVNRESPNALNTIVGHEITHVLEVSGDKSSKAYSELAQAVKDFYIAKEGLDKYNARIKTAERLYKGDTNTTPEAEVTADLVGEYIFTDYDFVQKLSVENRNVFQRIYDEIKYMVRIATAGSNEARKLEKAKKMFDKAWRDNIKGKPEVSTEAGVEEQGVKYSIREEAPPTKTKKAYKLMRLVDGKLYPLFIGNNEEVSVGTWYNADSPNLSQLKDLSPGTHLVNMETGEAITWDEYAEKYVPKKNGQPARSKPNKDDVHWANDNGYRFMHIEDKAGSKSQSRMEKQYGDTRAYYNWGVNGSSKSKSGEGSASLYALRPGWHFGEVPSMHQIGYGGDAGDTVRLDNQVWVEVEMSADVDYNAEAEANWGGDIPTHIPTDGYYKFATNPTQKKTKSGGTEADATKADWYVAGAFKVNRIISDTEADAVVENYNRETGRNVPLDYRRNGGRVFNAETMSIEDSVKYSLSSDSNGNKLSDGQKEFFKDSKVVDENGNLKVMYHGTSSGGHTVFDPWGKGRYGLFGNGIYFTDSRNVAESYTKKGKGTNPQVYESYLNITNPMDMDAQADPAQWQEAFPDAYFPESGTNEDFYRAMEEYFEDEGFVRWEAEETAQEAIMGMGYDGITHIGGGRVNPDGERHRVFIAFDPEQVKNTDNTNPTSDPDIRYSLSSDSEGRQLSTEQQDFFKDSKMRDADGNLKVMYHGSQNGGFHVFDPNFSDDDISLFFVDRNEVAMSYSGTSEIYEARTIRTAEDMNNFLAEIGQAESYEVTEENGKFILLEDGDEVATSDTAQDIYQEFCDWVGVGYGDVNYKVYLNLTNPLVVDAKGAYWNMLQFKTQDKTIRFEVQKVNGKWKIKDNFNGDYLEIDRTVAWTTEEYAQEALADYVEKYPKSQGFGNAVLNTTRDVAHYAKSQGYDGVILNNIRDNGGFSNGSEGASTVAIAFDSNQVKSTANAKPTANPDIRYSLSDNTWSQIHEMQSEVNRLNNSIREFESGDAFKEQMNLVSEAVEAGNVDSGVKAYQRWIKESGYEELLNKRNALRDELENLRKGAEETRATEALEEERKAIEKSGLSEADYFRKQAVKEFGYTPYFYDAGYITTNGKMLNFSGEKGQHFGSRGQDHRAIGIIYAETDGTDALNRFVNDGNIRISPESPGIDLSATVEPTNEQYATIKKFVYQYADKGYFSVDISDKNGKVIGSLEYENRIYPAKVIDDLKHYYETGEIRKQSDLGKFRYSLSEDSQGRSVSKEMQGLLRFSKVRDENGHLIPMYHGTPNGSIAQFNAGTYFTENKEYADRYQNPGASSISTGKAVSNPKTYEVYLDIRKPFDIANDVEARRIYVEEYIKGGNAIGINPYLSDAEYSKIKTIDWTEGEDLRDFLTENGYDYDGLVLDEGADGGYGEEVKYRGKSYVIFSPAQVVNITDPTGRSSLSDIGESQKVYGNYHVYGKDIGLPEDPLADFAPVEETAQETTQEAAQEEVAPAQGTVPEQKTVTGTELGRLLEENVILEAKMLEAVQNEDFANFNRMAAEWDALQTRIAELHGKFMDENYAPVNDDYDRLASLDDADAPPEVDAPYPGEPTKPSDPFADRDMKEVGKRNVKAYMYENPEVKPFFQQMAGAMLDDLHNGIKGEKLFNGDVYYATGGEKGWSGTKRRTTDDIAELLDYWNYTYAEIEKGLNAIIEDNGAENNAISKRIEFMLDERLRYGYKGVWGEPYPPDQDYINLLKEKQANEHSIESFEGLMENADQYAPPVEDVAPVAETPVAPIEEAPTREYEAIRPEPKKKPVVDDDIAPVFGDKLVRVDSNNGRPGEKRRKWVGTSTDSEAVDRKVLPDDLDQDLIHYQPISNKRTLGNANAKLNRMGYESSIAYLNGQFANNKVTLDDIALGERLIQEAVKRGDTKTAGDLIMDISILGTELGQKVQALSIIKRLTPEGQLRMLQRTIERGKAKGDKAYEGVELTQDIIDKILSLYGKDGTYDQAKLNEAVEKAKKQIADQMKVTAMDKVNAWRYLSMLGNPKTHIRNVVSNVAMRGTVAVKNAVARTIESIAPIKNRTKTWTPATKEVKAFARSTATEMKDVISGDSKYSEDASIKEKRDIFKFGVMNKLYEFNSEWLEKEDWWFSKPAFIDSMSEYLTVNGIRTEQDIQNNPKVVEKAKQYATEQSQIATFRQYSWLSNKISEMERHNAATQIAVGSIMPFKKTPINIAKTGLNYSPLGFAKTLTYDVAQVKNGNMEASELVDHLAQNMTGSALTLLGYMLANAGFLNGGGEDDKEGKYDYQLGEQGYSINIGGNSYSLSWLSPVAMPLFVGANAYEQLVEGKEWNGDVVVQTLAQTLDPLSEMSFLSGLNDVLSSYGSGIEKFAGVGEAMAQNYITQFVPTMSSQVATVMDDTKRSTKVGSDSGFKFFDETINKLKLKIPFLRQTLEPSTDIWGNDVMQTENVITRAVETFLAPYSGKSDISTHVDEEIKSLYRETGANGLIPAVPDNYVNFKGEKYEMSAQQFTAFKKTYGQTAFNLMDKLFRTETYRNASSEDRADLVERVYDYARDKAKLALLREHGVGYTNAQSDGLDVFKENAIKGAIENDMMPDEYNFSREYPEKYEFFKANNITYADYDSADEDGKRAYTWAYENPDKYLVSKAVTDDLLEYRRYSTSLNDIRADKTSSGKTVVGSAKNKKVEYINSLDIDYGKKLILFKSEYPADDTYNYEIIEYLNSRSDISYEDEVTILKELGFTVGSDGTVYWD